jgi:hypothetical protein
MECQMADPGDPKRLVELISDFDLASIKIVGKSGKLVERYHKVRQSTSLAAIQIGTRPLRRFLEYVESFSETGTGASPRCAPTEPAGMVIVCSIVGTRQTATSLLTSSRSIGAPSASPASLPSLAAL